MTPSFEMIQSGHTSTANFLSDMASTHVQQHWGLPLGRRHSTIKAVYKKALQKQYGGHEYWIQYRAAHCWRCRQLAAAELLQRHQPPQVPQTGRWRGRDPQRPPQIPRATRRKAGVSQPHRPQADGQAQVPRHGRRRAGRWQSPPRRRKERRHSRRTSERVSGEHAP